VEQALTEEDLPEDLEEEEVLAALEQLVSLVKEIPVLKVYIPWPEAVVEQEVLEL
jgi:hypothetical protein